MRIQSQVLSSQEVLQLYSLWASCFQHWKGNPAHWCSAIPFREKPCKWLSSCLKFHWILAHNPLVACHHRFKLCAWLLLTLPNCAHGMHRKGAPIPWSIFGPFIWRTCKYAVLYIFSWSLCSHIFWTSLFGFLASIVCMLIAIGGRSGPIPGYDFGSYKKTKRCSLGVADYS